MIKYKDLKKNDEVKTIQLGPPVSGKLLESPVQGRGLKRTILIYSNGAEVGYTDKKTGKMIPMHNDHGSVYAHEVTEVKREGTWQQVTDQPRTKATQQFIDAIEL
jgi:hypothetical protein